MFMSIRSFLLPIQLYTNYTDTKTFRIKKQLSIIRNNFPQMERSGFPFAETFDWRLIHREAKKQATILSQNKLQPQEEVDENGDCGRLLTTGRIYSAPSVQTIGWLNCVTTSFCRKSGITATIGGRPVAHFARCGWSAPRFDAISHVRKFVYLTRRTCVKFGYCARRSNSSRTHTVASRPSTLRPPLGSKTLKFGTELMPYCWQTGDSHSPMFTKWIARSSYFVLADSRTGPTLRQLPHQSA